MNLKGTLPVLILQVVSQEAMHGYRIAQEIKRLSRDVLEFKEGGLYPTLHSLEADGYLESYKQIAKGRTRRYYQITEKGTRTLAKERQEWQRLSNAVTLILGDAPC